MGNITITIPLDLLLAFVLLFFGGGRALLALAEWSTGEDMDWPAYGKYLIWWIGLALIGIAYYHRSKKGPDDVRF